MASIALEVIALSAWFSRDDLVPDAVLGNADSIEVAGSAADEELIKRLQEGKVYVPEQAA